MVSDNYYSCVCCNIIWVFFDTEPKPFDLTPVKPKKVQMPQQVSDVNKHIFLFVGRQSSLTDLTYQHDFCDTSKASCLMYFYFTV